MEKGPREAIECENADGYIRFAPEARGRGQS